MGLTDAELAARRAEIRAEAERILEQEMNRPSVRAEVERQMAERSAADELAARSDLIVRTNMRQLRTRMRNDAKRERQQRRALRRAWLRHYLGLGGGAVSVHVVPVADHIAHELDDDCACGPTNEPVMRDDGSCGWLTVHHSLDGRERDEATDHDRAVET